jgi:carbamoyl-phosphate synthase large subunit
VRALRRRQGLTVTFKTVTRARPSSWRHTPYLYSTYEEEDEAPPSDRRKVIILGSGPNRIGQGIEFDYCCVHAAFALKEMGVEAIMVQLQPGDGLDRLRHLDRLYFEPLTLEDVLNIVEKERPLGVIVQFGGQTPLKLAVPLQEAGVPILGTSPGRHRPGRGPRAIQRAHHRAGLAAGGRRHRPLADRGADDRGRHRLSGAGAAVVRAGRPAMRIVHDEQDLVQFVREAVHVAPTTRS